MKLVNVFLWFFNVFTPLNYLFFVVAVFAVVVVVVFFFSFGVSGWVNACGLSLLAFIGVTRVLHSYRKNKLTLSQLILF